MNHNELDQFTRAYIQCALWTTMDESNPNGSLENIAGVTNITRNVFGFMPHPERASESLVGNEDGLAIFESILSLARA